MPTSDIKKGPLYVDSTNNRVGIGTASPDTNLDVERSSNDAGGIKVQNTNNAQGNAVAQVEISGGDNAYANLLLECNATNHSIRQDGSGNLKITNGLTERMRIDSGGNVAIGNDNPQHKFHITHSATGAIPTDYQMGATSPNDNYQGIHNNNNSATFSGLALETRTSGASRWLIANEWKSTYLGDLVFRNRSGGTTSQESMRISSSGNVTMPYQPSFAASRSQGHVSNAANVYPI